MRDTSGLSKRAAARIASHYETWPAPEGARYDPDLHPEGWINMSTAENELITRDVIELLSRGEYTAQHLKYRRTLLKSSRPQLADLLPEYMSRQRPIRPITRANSVTGPGVGSLLAPLIWTLCDPGDGVLMSTPFYHDYTRDLIYPAQAIPVIAPVPAGIDSLSPAVLPILRERINSAADEGTRIKVLMLCNPHNPIPKCWPLETIEGYIDIAREYGLHLIADEVFANTTFPTADEPNPLPFISVMSLPAWAADSDMLDRLHILGGPTKDLGCSGLKAALLVSENAAVRKAVSLGLFAYPISGASDAALSAMLQDVGAVDRLLEKNRSELTRAMDTCAEWARFHGLPYIGANAGVYFILDLSPIAERDGLHGEEGTAELMKRTIAEGVHLAPTALDLDPRPHRFRIVFTKKPEILLLALGRLERALDLKPWKRLTNGYTNGHA